LWTKSFVAVCVGNFLLFFAFYLLLPILPLYLIEYFQTSHSTIGIILSCYTVAALVIRPMAGFILDRVRRKPVYLVAYFAFVIIFVGYAEATLLATFIIIRILHGLAFGLVTTAGNTVIVDIMPSQRRGEGLGYFGIANNLAMAIGPMVSLFMEGNYHYSFIFYFALALGLIGFIFASSVKVPVKNIAKVEEVKQTPYHLYDRFFLVKGLRAGICLVLLAIPYAMITGYIPIYGESLGFQNSMGIFFSMMAVGLIGSRLFSGRMVDKGYITRIIALGNLICVVSFFLLASLERSGAIYDRLPAIGFYVVPFLLGVGYGMIFPAFNTLFVNLAPNNRRATASSTYLTSWDVGIGLGLIAGGKIADLPGGLPLVYLVGAFAALFALAVFVSYATPHFNKNKLR
jgi:MFS family permease